MTDTGEQGFAHQDPAQRAGVGGGAVPDDQSEGQAETSMLGTDEGATEAADSADSADSAGMSTGGPTGPAAQAPKTTG
jgi:hypothetical protein